MTEALIKSEATAQQQEIYDLLNQNTTREVQLEIGWLHLGRLLTEFKNKEHWRACLDPAGNEYHSFDDFMSELRDRWHRGRTQLWAYQSVAEKLLPLLSGEVLDEIGISKAQELKRIVNLGLALDPILVEAARRPETTIKELRALIGQALNIPDERMPGAWFDLDGTFFTAEERQEFEDCWELTKRVLGLKKDQKECYHRHEILLAWIREFTGTHYADVYGPQLESVIPKLPEGDPDGFSAAGDASTF